MSPSSNASLPAAEHPARYFSRLAWARAEALAAALPLAALCYGVGAPDKLGRATRFRAGRSVKKALLAGGSSACAAIRGAQFGDRRDLGIDPYSGGALGASDALAATLLLEGEAGAERFKAAADSARSGVELAVMGLALRRSWILAATPAGAFPPQSQRLPNAPDDQALREAPEAERLETLRRAILAFSDWARAVERVGARKGLDPLDSFCQDLFYFDDCPREPVLRFLEEAFAHSPPSVVSALGARHIDLANVPLSTQPLAWAGLRMAREMAPSLAERSELKKALGSPIPPAPKKRSASL